MRTFSILLLIILFGCKQEIVSFPPNSLEIIYDKPGVLYPMSFGCGWPKNIDSIPENFKYIRVYDKVSVEKFLKLFNEFKTDSAGHQPDVRIKILVHQSIKTDTLCLGEHFGVTKNGEIMKDSKEILNFIKKRINFERK